MSLIISLSEISPKPFLTCSSLSAAGARVSASFIGLCGDGIIITISIDSISERYFAMAMCPKCTGLNEPEYMAQFIYSFLPVKFSISLSASSNAVCKSSFTKT